MRIKRTIIVNQGLMAFFRLCSFCASRVLSKPLHSRKESIETFCYYIQSHTFNIRGTYISFLATPYLTYSVMSRWFGSGLRNNAYSLSGYPRPIVPTNPDFSRCVPEFGRELAKRDCKEAIRTMPAGREGSEVDYAVNHHAQEWNLPMSYVWRIPPTADGTAEVPGK